MPVNKVTPWQVVNFIFIAILFILMTLVYFFMSGLTDRKTAEWENGSAGALTGAAEFDNQGLSLRADIKRFLSVYLFQQFASSADKQKFILQEFSRFSTVAVGAGEEAAVYAEFYGALSSLVKKMSAGEQDFPGEDSQLLALYNNL